MSQITIRDIPEPVEQEIRRLAAEKRTSLSKMVTLLIQKALGFEEGSKRDLSCMYGKWGQEEFEEFEKNIGIFKNIDEELWR